MVLTGAGSTALPALQIAADLFRASIIIAMAVLIWRFCRQRALFSESSWLSLCLGFALLSLAAVIDVSDGYPFMDP